MSHQPGEITAAIKSGYRITPHPTFFPHQDLTGETIHAEVDHAVRAVFCSVEFFEGLPKVEGA